MNNESIIHTVQQKLDTILLDHPEHFLVNIKIKPTNNIKVFIDGDKGVGIDELVKYNRTLYRQLEEGPLFADGDFSLEVSSPGLDEPLKMHRQYIKNIGRHVEVVLEDASIVEGKLLSVTDQEIVVEETIGKTQAKGQGAVVRTKKTEIVQHTILISNIKTIKIQIKF